MEVFRLSVLVRPIETIQGKDITREWQADVIEYGLTLRGTAIRTTMEALWRAFEDAVRQYGVAGLAAALPPAPADVVALYQAGAPLGLSYRPPPNLELDIRVMLHRIAIQDERSS